MRSKIFYRSVLIILLSISSSILVFANQIAITEDGKNVLLKDDGNWEYIKEEQKKEDLYDFRKTNWGINKAQVKITEKGKIVKEDENLIAYQGNISGLDCFIFYILAEGKLVRAKYAFTETHSNKNDYIPDYNSLKETLIKKYGKPIEDSHLWKNDLYRDDNQNWGFAVSLGHLVYFADWETSTTNISLALYGENYEISLAIEYQSKKLKSLEEKAKQKKTLDEF